MASVNWEGEAPAEPCLSKTFGSAELRPPFGRESRSKVGARVEPRPPESLSNLIADQLKAIIPSNEPSPDDDDADAVGVRRDACSGPSLLTPTPFAYRPLRAMVLFLSTDLASLK